MILPDLVLQSRINQRWQYSGLDSPEHCSDINYFKQYPYRIEYVYNSRGFRDQEWSDSLSDLQNAIWCIGDSYTVGLGQSFEHTWPQILQRMTGRRTVNVALDGASNQWIARRTKDIINHIDPKNIVIMWSHIERRELSIETAKQVAWKKWYETCKDITWPTCPDYDQLYLLPDYIITELQEMHGVPIDPINKIFVLEYPDESRRAQDAKFSFDDNFDNWCRCLDLVGTATDTIHSTIPKFAPVDQIDQFIDHLRRKNVKCIGECRQLDKARDGHHFDLITAQQIVEDIVPLLVDR